MSEPSFFMRGAHIGDCERDIPLHAHSCMEVVYLVRGECTVEVLNGMALPQRCGDVLIVPAGIYHSQSKSPGGITIFVQLSMDESRTEDAPRLVHCGEDALLRSWFYQLTELFENDPRKACLPAFWQALWTRLREYEQPQENMTSRNTALWRALDYLAQHFKLNTCTVDRIAQAGCISAGYLNVLFHRQFHCSPQEYLIGRRLTFARQLLANPYWNITEVAGKSGFADCAYFCRLFRRHEGMTPGIFRQQALLRERTFLTAGSREKTVSGASLLPKTGQRRERQ